MVALLSIDTKGMVAKLKAQEEAIKAGVTARLQKRILSMVTDLIQNTPQYSSNLVANWVIEVGAASQGFGVYTPISGYDPLNWHRTNPYKAGDASPGAMTALEHAEVAVTAIKWNSTITIANYTPYAEEVNVGVGPGGHPLRPQNFVNSEFAPLGIGMVEYIKMKYGQMGYL